MADWRNAGFTPEQTEYPASVALFSAGDAAFHFNGVWEVPTFTDLHAKGSLGDWSAVGHPAADRPADATWADSHAFAIPQQADKEIDPEKRKAVMEVIGWMEKNALRWADAGHIPAYLPVATSAEYKAMEPNATYAPLADNAAYDPRSTIAGVASPVYDADAQHHRAGGPRLPDAGGRGRADQGTAPAAAELTATPAAAARRRRPPPDGATRMAIITNRRRNPRRPEPAGGALRGRLRALLPLPALRGRADELHRRAAARRRRAGSGSTTT